MGNKRDYYLGAISILLISGIVSILLSRYVPVPIALATTATAGLLLLTLLRHGNPEGFANIVQDIMNTDIEVWDSYGLTAEDPDDPTEREEFTTAIHESYPTLPAIIILLAEVSLIWYSLSSRPLPSQTYGMVFDMVAGWVLVQNRIRGSPFSNIGIGVNTQASVEGAWGFFLLIIGFFLQFASTLLAGSSGGV